MSVLMFGLLASTILTLGAVALAAGGGDPDGFDGV
jgi:hypothetical protein